MDWQLDAAEARVLGALIEKEITTPDLYPLSLNALVNACNQKSNRDPVVAYDDGAVEAALGSLRAKGLATCITGADMRVPKHTERLIEKLNLGRREVALLCVLLLRGPQTPGELRGRGERLYSFDDLESVENTLDRMAEAGLVKKLPRQPGSRESRFAHLLSGDYIEEPTSLPRPAAPSDRDRLTALENEVADLKRAFEEFRARFE
jgi:uncharacterized protein YceH (UPF0502 family)